MAGPSAARRRPAAVTLAVILLVAGVQLHSSAAAADDPDDPLVPAGRTYTPPEIDGDDPELRMREGATLERPRVLDIVSIVESEGGEERREQTTTSLKFALQAEVLFGKDSADLSPQANSRISAIAEEIRKNDAQQVRVFGFTDNLGSYRHGRILSRKRADAVHGMLGDQLEDPAVTYIVRGYSEDFPIADNSTEEGRKKNRRVEVSFPTDGGS
ncbi:OmpA family protein [Streptomyces sp. NPDC000594]|uniref:OmpA family protein n=1 Tax=Streptomyces sp. NPDC000594 TaxID=3154261 RepID=UPI003321350E